MTGLDPTLDPALHPGPDRTLDSSGLPGLDPAWSRLVTASDADGVRRRWHVLDNQVDPTEGTLLCVHGNPTWSYLWRGLVAAAPPGWRVVAPDHLGMGFSERLDEPRTLAQRVADLGALTRALGVTGSVVTVGHDWGGALSLGWALNHRDQVRGVVLTNTALAQPPGDRGPALIRLAHVPVLREVGCVRTLLFVRSAASLSRPALAPEVRRALALPYGTAERRRSVGDFVADIPFAQGHPSRPALEAIAEGVRSLDVPALLLWGPRDPVFAEKYLADLRHRLPQAELHRYEGASHLVTEDAPQYAEAVADWVGELDQPPTRPAPASTPEATWAAAPDTRAGTTAGPRLWSALEARSADPGPAVVEVGGPTLSWSELARRVRDLAAGFAEAGLRPGDRVAMLVPPSTELTTAVYAGWRAGGVVVVADRGLGFTGMRRALRSASVDWVVGSREGLAAARLMGLPGKRVAVGAVPGALRRALGVTATLDELAAQGSGLPVPAEPPVDQDCAVLFTSGATGPAKGVLYRHPQAMAQLELVRSTYSLSADDRLVAAFAPFALLGPGLGIGSVLPDVDVTAPGTLTAAALADAVTQGEASLAFAAPAALRNVAATASGLSESRRAALAQLRLVMSAGAPVPVRLLVSLQEAVLPGAELHTPYGMTEALPVTDVTLAELLEAGSGNGVCVGWPVRSVEVAVSPLAADGRAGSPLTGQAEVTGELCVRAPHVKDRYDNLWATQRESARFAGWHRTGDVGHLDEQGRVWVEGRAAHVITPPDGVLTPVGVEQRVEQLDEVRAAAVVGVGPAGTQAVVVVVVPAGTGSDTGSDTGSNTGSDTGSARSRRGRLRVADAGLADKVRRAAAREVAAVLITDRLPVDIRHASKVDRRRVAEHAARCLAGS